MKQAKHIRKWGMRYDSYVRLWQTMKKKGISQYKLVRELGFSNGQLDRHRKNENVNTYTLNVLCRIFDCCIKEIIEHISDK